MARYRVSISANGPEASRATNSKTGRHGASRRPACPSVNCFGGAFAVELPATQNRQLRTSCASGALPVEIDRRLPAINFCEVFKAYGDEAWREPGFSMAK